MVYFDANWSAHDQQLKRARKQKANQTSPHQKTAKKAQRTGREGFGRTIRKSA